MSGDVPQGSIRKWKGGEVLTKWGAEGQNPPAKMSISAPNPGGSKSASNQNLVDPFNKFYTPRKMPVDKHGFWRDNLGR